MLCPHKKLFISKVSPFVAYQIATAIPKGKTRLSTEHIYDKIKGITRRTQNSPKVCSV